ncbi:MAG: hypothetical protein L7V30_02870 [Gammaproteobacteria bacterium]|nr:hypothetical protein [Gammaproteobacteria bacterium]
MRQIYSGDGGSNPPAPPMKIGVFGASEASWFGYSYPCADTNELSISWNDIVCKYFKAEQYNRAVLQGSMERVLHELKKCKKDLDLAIVIISHFKFIYLPTCDIDFSSRSSSRVEDAFESKGIQHGRKFENYKNFSNQFKSKEEYVTLVNLYKKYLYNAESAQNRQAGILSQIDLWLKTKNIKTIYLSRPANIPPWVSLSAGNVYDDMYLIAKANRRYVNLPNNISVNGQKLIAKWLIKRIKNDFKIK